MCSETLGISKDYTIKFRGTTSSAEATTSRRLAELQAFLELGLTSTAELRCRNQGAIYTDEAGVAVPGALSSEPPRGRPGVLAPSWKRCSCEDDRGASLNLGILAFFFQIVI